MTKTFLSVLMLSVFGIISAAAQTTVPDELKNNIQSTIQSTVPQNMGIGAVKVNSIAVDDSKCVMTVDLNENFSYVPFTVTSINDLKSNLTMGFPQKYKAYTVNFTINGSDINNFFPLFSTDLQRKHEDRFITSTNPLDHCAKGLDGNIIALWQSHGWYFEPKLNRWEWQRARIFQTVEDLYTQSYVIPFLMPMLENAGAYVFSPRERDVNAFEAIIDNDEGLGYDGYSEHRNGEKWKKGDSLGFAYKRPQYEAFENPFTEGTYRMVKATKNKDKITTASWSVEVPKTDDYAVYISYKTLPASVTDVVYTVNSMAGAKTILVNQKMGGGTWIYLGHFPLKQGLNKNVVEIQNYSSSIGVITADAVKIGGGMGNIARKVSATSENVKSSDATIAKEVQAAPIDYRYQLSNHPRYTEGARYFLQWAGMPDSVYSPTKGVNDYTDDYRCRGVWVNYLAGGSRVLPAKKGLNLPVDIAFAFHSDAGTTMDDKIIGTLGIYFTQKFGKYADGTPRILSRDLTNKIMTNIVTDVRKQYEPLWTRRGMWDESYFEARVPEVPTMLLELLSHQNFADMKYGLDPTFRFTVSRAIYKGMLQFIAQRDGRAYVVQPLPVNNFAIKPVSDKTFMLTWLPTKDTLTENSDATKYIIYERVGEDGFKELATTAATQYVVSVSDNLIHSYKIVALNDGGKSFPSEVLSLGIAEKPKGNVLVVNGFTRISGPDWFDSGKMAGFYDEKDHGVPYMKQINFIGSQFEFRRNIPWMDDDAAGFGASRSNYETQVIAGNTFDYPVIHGEALMSNGYSFVSSSVQAFEQGQVNAAGYKAVDLILGKQKEVQVGRGAVPSRFKAFPEPLRNVLTEFSRKGVNIMVSGAFVATDIWDKEKAVDAEKKFAQEVLGYNWRTGQASLTGEVYAVPSVFSALSDDGNWNFYNQLNSDMYAVESPDALYPFDDKTSSTIMRYKENNLPAGVATSKNGYKAFVIGFPFEVVKGANSRAALMGRIMNFFNGDTATVQNQK